MIGAKRLVDCVNAAATTVTDPIEILQLASVVKDFDQTGFVASVATSSALPAAANNTGRFIYVQDSSDYRFSDGESWTTNVSSTISLASAWTWGPGTAGQLGDGTTVDKSSPVSVIGGFTDWCQISSGYGRTSVALRTNGTAWAWGCNYNSSLGDGTTVNRSSPVLIAGGFTDWCHVNRGPRTGFGIRTNGTAWAWGNNYCGKLGDGTAGFVDKSSPVSVVGGFTDWCQISAHESHTLGLRKNGSVWAWGCNNCGELGDGTTIAKSSPISIIGGFTDWCQVSGGGRFSVGLRTNGTVWSWGYNKAGQLGDGTFGISAHKSSPIQVVGGFTDWCRISGGPGHVIGIRSNGTMWSWGCNLTGTLGDGTTVNKYSPVSVVGGFTDWCEVYNNFAIRKNGTMWAWGNNYRGRLGDGTTVNRSSPVSVIGGFTDWYRVGSIRVEKGF